MVVRAGDSDRVDGHRRPTDQGRDRIVDRSAQPEGKREVVPRADRQHTQLGTAFGGQGITSLVVSDLDLDGQAELLFVYSFGSGIHQSRIGMYAPAYDEYQVFEADLSYLGDLRLYSESPPDVRVQIVEADHENLILTYLDMIGNLAIEEHDGQVKLVMHVFPSLPDEIQQKINTD